MSHAVHIESHPRIFPSTSATFHTTIPIVQNRNRYSKRVSRLERREVPKCLKYYRMFSYIMFSVTIITSIAYMVHVGTILFDPVLHIRYEPVIRLFEYNSYNLQCPILTIIFAAVFIYHVRHRVKLDEGDFFGLMGFLLLFAMVMLYDATGVQHLYAGRMEYLSKHPDLPPTENMDRSNVLAWQYAWSTNPSCAKIHAKYHEKKESEESEEKEGHRSKATGPKLIHLDEAKKPVNFWFSSGKTKEQLIQGLSGQIKNNIENSEVVEVEEETPEDHAYKTICGSSSDSIAKTKPKKWMERIHQKFQCCGPQGYDHWVTKVNDMSSCTKNGKTFTRGCAVPFSKYLADRFYTLMIFMYLMGFLFIIVLITAILHFSAMKYDFEGIAKEYSMLDLTDPEGIIIIDIHNRGGRKSKAIMGDPTRALFQQANIRAQSGHRKSGIATTSKDSRGSGPQHQTVGKTVVAFNKGKKVSVDAQHQELV